MKTISTALFVLLLATFAQAQQTWIKTYGGKHDDRGYSVQQTTDGGYIIAGYSFSFRDSLYGDVYLIKTNASGDTAWTKTYGGTNVDVGWSVQQTSDGGYIVAGQTASFGAGYTDVYLIKTNASGDTTWTRTYGATYNDLGYSVQQTSDGGYVISGATDSYGVGGDVYLVKTNAAGDTLWTRTCGGTGEERGYSVQQTTDGGYIVAGNTYIAGRNHDVYIVKTNASGDTLWTRTCGGTGEDMGYSLSSRPRTGVASLPGTVLRSRRATPVFMSSRPMPPGIPNGPGPTEARATITAIRPGRLRTAATSSPARRTLSGQATMMPTSSRRMPPGIRNGPGPMGGRAKM